jgi:Endomembrane protein 70
VLHRRDVFRFPPQRNLFCAFVGTGTQLLGLAVAIFGLACMNLFYPYNRWALAPSGALGAMLRAAVVATQEGPGRTIHMHGAWLSLHHRMLAAGCNVADPLQPLKSFHVHRCRGGLYTALIVLYAATSGIAGYSGSSYYKQMEGTNWVRPCCTSLIRRLLDWQ